MHPELETLVKRAAPNPLTGPDVAAIVSGGRRLRTQRRVLIAGAVAAIVAVAITAGPAAIDVFVADRFPAPQPPAAPQDAEPFREVEPLPYREVYVDRVVGEQRYLIGKKEIVAAGKVLGRPWSMVEFITTEDRPRSEAALCVEFFLGADGMLGGGGNCATPKHIDSVISLSGQYWGSAPEIVAVIGSVEKPAVAARVELKDGRTRELEIVRSRKDEDIGWYVFFPPPFERGRVVALDANGNEVGARPICFPIEDGGFSMEPPPEGSNMSCSQ